MNVIKVRFIAFALSFAGILETVAQKTNNADSVHAAMGSQISLAEMMAKIPGVKGEQYAVGMKHGTMELLLYAPKEKDLQTPHDKDEVYIVVSGNGIFFDGNHRYAFKKGDVLFVPAKTEHRFENFSKDFVSWVVFYGKEGGEK